MKGARKVLCVVETGWTTQSVFIDGLGDEVFAELRQCPALSTEAVTEVTGASRRSSMYKIFIPHEYNGTTVKERVQSYGEKSIRLAVQRLRTAEPTAVTFLVIFLYRRPPPSRPLPLLSF